MLKFAKNQANAKQHHEVKLLPFENYSHSSATLSSKNNKTFWKQQKNKCACINNIKQLINENEYENEKKRSHRYDINRPSSMMILILWCIK